MNNQLTLQYLATFAQAIRDYLRYNTEYRQNNRNSDRKTLLKTARATAWRIAQEANTTLHSHLLQYTEPDFLRANAHELIARWVARNQCFDDLRNAQNTAHWHERPADKIQRLDRAETRLREQLKTIETIIQKLAQ